MKKSGIITLVFGLALLTFTSCQKEEGIASSFDALELEADVAADLAFESIDEVVEGGIAIADNVRVDERKLADCAIVTHNMEEKTIVVDFGEGCEDRKGNSRSGKILISYNDKKYVPGAYRITTFEDFYFNDIKVEGTRTLTNTTTTEAEREFTLKLEGGKLDFGDDVFATRDAEWIRTWFVGQGQISKSGGATGTNINGIDYSTSVDASTPLLFSRDCSKGIPVSGIKVKVVGDRIATVDYGDGTCDRLATVTVDGETKVKELKAKRGKRK